MENIKRTTLALAGASMLVFSTIAFPMWLGIMVGAFKFGYMYALSLFQGAF